MTAKPSKGHRGDYNLLKTRKSLIYWTENKHKNSHPAKIYSGQVQIHLQILTISRLSPSKTIKELIFLFILQ